MAKEHPISVPCADCGQDVARYEEQTGFTAVCTYCALEDGTLPLEEIDCADPRTLHQIAMDERQRLATHLNTLGS